ncbi:YjfB family protein [Bacillus badius]|uniref:Motility protein n=1 Tax=Bacillus badius TaxID=1455 RepID=A0ABR5AUJ5_BACBA|nr:YjfB family protein [Bacillus badius]KIL78426.1 hypothetical protein SD77_4106 [Bacillus badius]MED4716082.1 YjfB family protein [Bacillus badius]
MDIALLSIALHQGQVQQQASLSVMKKAMDQAKGNAEFIHQMMSATNVKALEHATQPHGCSFFDKKV